MLEASGNVTPASVRAIAETGVDYISSGAITHSAPNLDLDWIFNMERPHARVMTFTADGGEHRYANGSLPR